MAHKSALNGITQLYCQWNIWIDHSCIWLLYKLCFESVTYKLAYFIHTSSPLTWQAIFKDKKRVTLFSSCFFFFFQVFHNWSISLSISLEDFNYIFIYNVRVNSCEVFCFHEYYYSQYDSVPKATLMSFHLSQAGVRDTKKRYILSMSSGQSSAAIFTLV